MAGYGGGGKAKEDRKKDDDKPKGPVTSERGVRRKQGAPPPTGVGRKAVAVASVPARGVRSKQGAPPPTGAGRKADGGKAVAMPQSPQAPRREAGPQRVAVVGKKPGASPKAAVAMPMPRPAMSASKPPMPMPRPAMAAAMKPAEGKAPAKAAAVAKGPPTKLAPTPPEVKKGFFANLFNARTDPSTRKEYDRMRGGSRK